jgi:hypothetical protein
MKFGAIAQISNDAAATTYARRRKTPFSKNAKSSSATHYWIPRFA